MYRCKDKLYKTHASGRTSKEGVNGNWAVTDMWRYVSHDPSNIVAVYSPHDKLELESVSELVSSLREACGNLLSSVWWHNERIGYQLLLEVAIHEMPPGCVLIFTEPKTDAGTPRRGQ